MYVWPRLLSLVRSRAWIWCLFVGSLMVASFNNHTCKQPLGGGGAPNHPSPPIRRCPFVLNYANFSLIRPQFFQERVLPGPSVRFALLRPRLSAPAPADLPSPPQLLLLPHQLPFAGDGRPSLFQQLRTQKGAENRCRQFVSNSEDINVKRAENDMGNGGGTETAEKEMNTRGREETGQNRRGGGRGKAKHCPSPTQSTFLSIQDTFVHKRTPFAPHFVLFSPGRSCGQSCRSAG